MKKNLREYVLHAPLLTGKKVCSCLIHRIGEKNDLDSPGTVNDPEDGNVWEWNNKKT